MAYMPNFSTKVLSKAKVFEKEVASRSMATADPLKVARNKFIQAIDEQKSILEADASGEAYVSATMRRHIDKETGETYEKSKRLRRWFWKNGELYRLQLYYGNKHLIEQVFEFASSQDVQEFFDGIIDETNRGILDESFISLKRKNGRKLAKSSAGKSGK